MSGSPSADRLAQVLSAGALRPPEEGGADSTPPGQAAPTVVSAAAGVRENQRGVSSVSEGVASAGLPPQAPMGEFVGEFVPPSSTAEQHGTHSLAAGFQGETSGMFDTGPRREHCGETAAGGGGLVDPCQPGTASAQVAGAAAAAASHHAGYAGLAAAQQGVHSKRKMSEMGEVRGPLSPGAAATAEEVQECDMWQQAAAVQQQAGLSADSGGDGVTGGFNRVPSDVAMVLGDAPFESAEAAAAAEFDSAGMLPDDCDSNMARAIQASLDDARRKQEQQQQQQVVAAAPAAGVSGGAPAAAAVGEAVLDSSAKDPNRPSDADIIAWENQIRESERRAPLVGDREPLDALAAEYAHGSSIYQQKIDRLRSDYGSIRRTRGDGNCFFRAFLFGYLEHLLLSGDAAECARVLARLEAMKRSLVEVGGYDEIVLETPLDMVLQMLRSVGAPLDPLTVEVLESNVRDEDISNYSVWLLRMVTSSEIKRRSEFFAPFIMGVSDLDVPTFCSKFVDPMGEESDNVQLVALTDALQVPIRVVYLDRSLAPGGGGGDSDEVQTVLHDFVPEGCPAPAALRVHLLYRPGHYDLLYPLTMA